MYDMNIPTSGIIKGIVCQVSTRSHDHVDLSESLQDLHNGINVYVYDENHDMQSDDPVPQIIANAIHFNGTIVTEIQFKVIHSTYSDGIYVYAYDLLTNILSFDNRVSDKCVISDMQVEILSMNIWGLPRRKPADNVLGIHFRKYDVIL